ncbi:MAG: hypothetical protein CL610_13485 [Anaerolineaceae bacterium]|nr:hypothetical protein [Anaerolineaceae bacterium]
MMPRNRRFSEIMLGLFLLFLGATALFEGGNVFMTFLVLAGIFMLVRQFESGRTAETRRPMSRRREVSEPVEESRGDQRRRIYQHALEAVEAAGHDPQTVKVLVTDIGMMAFKSDQEPVVYRAREILDDVDYIQPYVQLRLPTRAVGRIRFEIIDPDGQILFVHEEQHQLERGRNLITPAARLPIHDAHIMDDAWELRVSADGTPLAVHQFGWEETATRVVRRHLTEDGEIEISNELRTAIAENRLQDMSLDELLDFQDEEEDRSQQQR